MVIDKQSSKLGQNRSNDYPYLTLTKNWFPTLPVLISFVVWELDDRIGILVWYQYFGILVLNSDMGILDIVLVS